METQTKIFEGRIPAGIWYNRSHKIVTTLEFENGYFSITADIHAPNGHVIACGCLHEEIEKYFPNLRKYIKWHLCEISGPMFYIENTLFHVKNGDFNYARGSAIWPDATEKELQDKGALLARLPGLIAEFKEAMTEIGFKV